MKLLISLTALLLASTAFAQDKAPAPAGSADSGQKVYAKLMCYTCHGTVGQGADRGTGPKLAPNPVSFATFQTQLRTPRADMPPYRKEFLTDQELADIYAYIGSIKTSPAAKDLPLPNF